MSGGVPHPFPTQEIGSLPKFGWRTKPFRLTPLQDEDIDSARSWGERLRVPRYKALLNLLAKKGRFTDSERKRIVNFSVLYAIRMQELAGGEGLDLIWTGEQARTEMYETPVSGMRGFEFIGRVRSFDNKYWRIASVRKRVDYGINYHLEELLYILGHTRRAVKVPVTDAITLMAWSDDYHYARRWSKVPLPPSSRSFGARRDFTLDLARVIRRVIRELIQRGAKEIQLDIPAATQYQSVEDARLVSEAFNETTRGLNATFSVHSCFPPRVGYASLFPSLLEMKNCSRYSFEYANRDGLLPGVNPQSRPGYSDLRLFREYGYTGELGVGVVHVHSDTLPSVETVRDRILYASKVTDLPPEKIFVTPDCGLRTRSPQVAYSMLELVVAGAKKAREGVS